MGTEGVWNSRVTEFLQCFQNYMLKYSEILGVSSSLLKAKNWEPPDLQKDLHPAV